MSELGYLTPESVREAVLLLSRHGEKSRILAGGTDLVKRIKEKAAPPDIVISIRHIGELDYINDDGLNGLRIGALTTISSIAGSALVRTNSGILSEAAGSLGTPTIRRRATIGGNLCNAAPSADTAPALIVLGAMVKIVGKAGERVVPVEDFFKGPGQTVIGAGEMLTEVRIPGLPPRSGGAYIKQKRRQGADLALVGAAALVTIEGGVLSEVRIALGAVAPTPIRAKKAEEILKGKEMDDGLLEEVGRAASYEARPIDDTRSSADYRRKTVAVLVKRAVQQAVERVPPEV